MTNTNAQRPARSLGPYTPQYGTITGTGHTRPTQEIGSPTLVWHVAVWPAKDCDPQDARPTVEKFDLEKLKAARKSQAIADVFKKAVIAHNTQREALIGGPGGGDGVSSLNALLHKLQKAGLANVPDADNDGPSPDRRREEYFDLVYADEDAPSGKDDGLRLKFTTPGSRGITLWWRDRIGDKPNRSPMAMPGYEPLRVRVQVETEIDYFAITFLIDVGNPWNAGQVFSSAEALGERRRKIFGCIEGIREKCEGDLVGSGGSLDKPLVPLDRVPPTDLDHTQSLEEHIRTLGERIEKESVPAAETAVLLEASKYLYAGVWNEFCEDFGFEFKDIPGTKGRVFANFRGLVMSTAGADHLRDKDKPAPWAPEDGSVGPRLDAMPPTERRATASPGKQPFRKFDGEGTEPNAVVKAYWPFIRRIKPFADYREYIACGVFNWRALYITALGSPSEYDIGDESMGRSYEVPSGNLPELRDSAGKRWLRRRGDPALPDDPLLGEKGEEPVRYLLLTKYEPHRRQLGRIIDRINALGTMRLFALKGWSEIRDSSEHIRMRGQQLDQVMARWIEARREINAIDDPDERNRTLSALNEVVELHLIEIAAGLDGLGAGAIGGLPYRIARSHYFSQRFAEMTKTLNVGNIETWTSYDQFATRGLRPVFEFIEGVGDRLRALRQRLTNVMQSIQTSALVSQSEETRKNTRALEMAQYTARGATIGGLLALWLAAFEPIAKLSKYAVDSCKAALERTSRICEWHASLAGGTDNEVHVSYLAALGALFVVLAIIGWFGTRRERSANLN